MSYDLSQRSVVITGLARNCGQHLLYVLDNVHSISTLFGQSGFVFAENDSTDATAQMLAVFCAHKANSHLLNFNGVGSQLPERTRRFAFLRNSCLSFILSHTELRAFDYLVVLDMDDVNIRPLDTDAVVKAFQFLDEEKDTAGVFPNCRGIYYDMWTLREPTRCPGDVFEDQLDYVLAKRVDDVTAYEKTFESRLFTLPETDPPLPVISAFGGLGIYKMAYAMKSSYKGYKSKEVEQNGSKKRFRLQVCEHVAFNEQIVRQGGRLYILPFLINRITEGIEFNATAYRSMIF